MSIYYKYATDGTTFFVLSYVDDCVYWYTNEAIGKWFVYTLGKCFHVNFLGYAHWFMSILFSQMRDHSISLHQARYATSIVAKYLNTATVKSSKTFYETTLPSDMIFNKPDTTNSDEQVEKFTRKLNIHYRASIGLFIYLFPTRVNLSFAVYNIAKFSAGSIKVHFEGLVHILIYIKDNETFALNYYADINYALVSYLFRQADIKT